MSRRFRIAELVEAQGITLSELHRRILERAPPDRTDLRNIAYPTVLRVANNQTKRPGYSTLEGIALGLGVEVRDLYEVSSTSGDGQKNLEPLCA
ncbi:helix-turn-helix transcriptional regulator [Chloroflexus sp.]|uniref:helix-turn-helix domain-containing protein n=1 Tax=Chloroflexus sp. TaxID=1904827 RepID=UPI002ACDC679|nr:helix-turn-helix transcriptional regulator [Chloroflexus sp.]